MTLQYVYYTQPVRKPLQFASPTATPLQAAVWDFDGTKRRVTVIKNDPSVIKEEQHREQIARVAEETGLKTELVHIIDKYLNEVPFPPQQPGAPERQLLPNELEFPTPVRVELVAMRTFLNSSFLNSWPSSYQS